MASPATTASTQIELTAVDGTPITLMLVKAHDDKGHELPGTLSETLSAAVADSPLADWLEPSIQEDWSGGVGNPKNGYNMAPGATGRFPGYVIPAGAATRPTLPALNNSLSPFVAIEEFGADLFMAQEGLSGQANSARVIRSVGGTGSGGGLFANSLNLGAGRIMRDLCLFGGYLYAFSTDDVGGAGEMHRWNGAAWSLGSSDASFSGALFSTGRNRTVKVNWKTEGVAAHRLFSIDGSRSIAYTRPFLNPMLETSWVTAVPVETGFSLVDLAAARKHVYIGARDGLYDFDEQGNSPSLTGYEVHALSASLPFPVHYLNNFVYVSLGYQLDRVYVGANGQLQQEPGNCAPGIDTWAENEYRGYVTAMCDDQGWLVAAVYNPITRKTGIFWGKDRSLLGIEAPQPLVWQGPEVHGVTSWRVTKMRTSSLAGDLRLWICSRNVADLNSSIDWVSLPNVGTPIVDLVSNGLHRFATGVPDPTGSIYQSSCQLHSLGDTGGDKGATKIPFQVTFGTRGLPATGVAPGVTDPYLAVYTTADAPPTSPVWGSVAIVTNGPTQTVTPTVQSGKKIYTRVDFFQPNGQATPPTVGLLDSLRWEWWRTVTAFRVLHLDVEYGTEVSNLYGGVPDDTGPEDKTVLLKALGEAPPTTLRLWDDSRWSVKVRQVLDARSTSTRGAYGKRMAARLQIALISRIS